MEKNANKVIKRLSKEIDKKNITYGYVILNYNTSKFEVYGKGEEYKFFHHGDYLLINEGETKFISFLERVKDYINS